LEATTCPLASACFFKSASKLFVDGVSFFCILNGRYTRTRICDEIENKWHGWRVVKMSPLWRRVMVVHTFVL
jgi:hypothetical protein